MPAAGATQALSAVCQPVMQNVHQKKVNVLARIKIKLSKRCEYNGKN
jgi:hypothetical protein